MTGVEMAEHHGIGVNSLYRVLRADAQRPPEKRQLPGAEKVGSKYRGEWRIPRAVALAWQPRKRGRPSLDET